MNVNIKVNGTSFHPLPEGAKLKIESEGQFEGISAAFLTGLLCPEPTNPYDPDAVAVYVPLTDGKAHHLGYVPKDADIKMQIKTPKKALILAKDFAAENPKYSVSYEIRQIGGM